MGTTQAATAAGLIRKSQVTGHRSQATCQILRDNNFSRSLIGGLAGCTWAIVALSWVIARKHVEIIYRKFKTEEHALLQNQTLGGKCNRIS